MWIIGIAMCYLDCFIENINYTVQDFLIIFFELLARIILITGALKFFPSDPYSNKRVWFYYIIMGGSIAALESFIKLIGIVVKA